MDKGKMFILVDDYRENEGDLNKINYKVFPLTLVFDTHGKGLIYKLVPYTKPSF